MGLQENLRKLRKDTGLTAKEFAAKLGLKYPTYAAYETQGREPRYDILCKIADALETSVDALLGHYEGDSYVRKYFALKEKIEKLLEEE